MTLKSPYVCLPRRLILFLTVKYNAELSILNFKKMSNYKIRLKSSGLVFESMRCVRVYDVPRTFVGTVHEKYINLTLLVYN